VDHGLLTNPFYYLILHLSIADTLCVAASGCYTGLVFCQMAFPTNLASWMSYSGFVRFFGFLINVTYYVSGWMLVLIMSTRLFSLGYPHLKQKLFLWTILGRLRYTALALPCLFHDSIAYIIDIKSLMLSNAKLPIIEQT
uniref:Uncharacterized protein n=1 Tax=Romanomermis culicivorax TaxID=13658 RepID=A0A915ILI8_ROMCU